MGFLPPSDKPMQDTVVAIADELTEDDLALRYRVTGTDTGLAGDEGTFTICSFWLVSALTMIGETDRARALSRSCCRSLGRSCSTRRRSTRRPASISATFPRPSLTLR
jgi:GH15 family glucan-1,4-alpha-glucosidase